MSLLGREEAQDLPHAVLFARDPHERHAFVERAIRTFSRGVGVSTPPDEIRRARTTVVVPDSREVVEVEYTSCPRAVRVDVAENTRSKNRAVTLSPSAADGILAFVKETIASHDIRFARRMVVVESFDMLPSHVRRGFERIMERATPASWMIFTVASMSHLGDPILSRCFVINANGYLALAGTTDDAGSVGGVEAAPGGPGRAKDAQDAPTSIRRLVNKAMHARTCRTLVPVKVPRCVSALGPGGIVKAITTEVLRWDVADRSSHVEAVRALITRLTGCDRMQALARGAGNIGEDDEAFVDAILTVALLHVRRFALDVETTVT